VVKSSENFEKDAVCYDKYHFWGWCGSKCRNFFHRCPLILPPYWHLLDGALTTVWSLNFMNAFSLSVDHAFVLRHISQRVSLIVVPDVCMSVCLSVIPRPTAYHDWPITTKFGMQVHTCPRTRVSLFGPPVPHTLGARGKNMQIFAYGQL